MVRLCWVNFHCRIVLLIWTNVAKGPTVLAVGAGGGCLDIFSLVYHFSLLSSSLWEMVRYRLNYCLKRPLKAKQLTNQLTINIHILPPFLKWTNPSSRPQVRLVNSNFYSYLEIKNKKKKKTRLLQIDIRKILQCHSACLRQKHTYLCQIFALK